MTRARVDQYENKENKGSKSGQPCNLCRGALNRALAITRNIMLLIDRSIVISYALRKTRGVSRCIYRGLYLEVYQEKYNIFLSSFFLTHVRVHIQTEYIMPIHFQCPFLGSCTVVNPRPIISRVNGSLKEATPERPFFANKDGTYADFFLFFFFISISSPALIRSHCARFCPRRFLPARRLNRLYREATDNTERDFILSTEILHFCLFCFRYVNSTEPQTFSNAAPVSRIKA